MAKSVTNKLLTALKGQIHKLADKAYNTPEAYAQEIRQLEQAIKDLAMAKYSEEGRKAGNERKISDRQSNITKWNEDIELILGDSDDSNDDSAVALQMDIDKATAEISQYQIIIAECDKTISAMDQAISRGNEVHADMVRKMEKLKMDKEIANAKNRAADAIEVATDAFGTTSSIDSIASKIEAEKDKADARFEGAVGGLGKASNPERDAAVARAKAAIAAKKAELKDKKS